MDSSFWKSALLWGFVLWLVGYVLGIVLFFVVPVAYVGWVIMPVGVLFTVWVLSRKIRLSSRYEYIFLGVVWTAIALVCDYFLLVQVFKPADGYYKLDVYLYYVLTFVLPVLVGWRKGAKL